MSFGDKVKALNIMNADKESLLYNRFYQKYNVYRYPELKHKKDGTLDMRYSENIQLFGKEYKKYLLKENRKYNIVYDGPYECYRSDILKLSEEDIAYYNKKIEIKAEDK